MLKMSKEEFVLSFLKKEHAAGRHLGHALKARELAIEWHKESKRDDGTPYFGHPNELVYVLILIGITDEDTLAAGFLHDTIEDEGKSREDIEEKVNRVVAYLVFRMSKHKGMTTEELRVYFNGLTEDIRLVFLKTVDRLINMRRSMFGVFNKKRMSKYIFETETFILAISEEIINSGEYPEYENSLRLLRSFIKGILEAARAYVVLMETAEKNEETERRIGELLATVSAIAI